MSENINGGCYDRLKREGNLNKTHFSYFGVLRSFFGSYLAFGSNDYFIVGLYHGGYKAGTKERNLKNCTISQVHPATPNR